MEPSVVNTNQSSNNQITPDNSANQPNPNPQTTQNSSSQPKLTKKQLAALERQKMLMESDDEEAQME